MTFSRRVSLAYHEPVGARFKFTATFLNAILNLVLLHESRHITQSCPARNLRPNFSYSSAEY